MRRGSFRCLVMAMVVATGTAPGAAETVLRFSHYGSLEDTAHAAAERFQDLVEVGTDGAIEIEVYPDNELGAPASVLQDVRLGTIDIALVGNPQFASFEPEMSVLDLPFLFGSPGHAYRVLDGEIGRAILDKLEQHGLKGLALWEVGFRSLTNDVRPIRTPKDLQGLAIATSADPNHLAAFELLGAKPAPLPLAELSTALRTGAIDGQENPLPRIYASRLHEVQAHLSITRHAYTAAPLVMNLAIFNALPEDQRNVIMEAALEAAQFQREENASNNESAITLMREDGVQVVTDPDVAAFRDIVADRVRQEYVAKHGTGMLERIDELR